MDGGGARPAGRARRPCRRERPDGDENIPAGLATVCRPGGGTPALPGRARAYRPGPRPCGRRAARRGSSARLPGPGGSNCRNRRRRGSAGRPHDGAPHGERLQVGKAGRISSNRRSKDRETAAAARRIAARPRREREVDPAGFRPVTEDEFESGVALGDEILGPDVAGRLPAEGQIAPGEVVREVEEQRVIPVEDGGRSRLGSVEDFLLARAIASRPRRTRDGRG